MKRLLLALALCIPVMGITKTTTKVSKSVSSIGKRKIHFDTFMGHISGNGKRRLHIEGVHATKDIVYLYKISCNTWKKTCTSIIAQFGVITDIVTQHLTMVEVQKGAIYRLYRKHTPTGKTNYYHVDLNTRRVIDTTVYGGNDVAIYEYELFNYFGGKRKQLKKW